MIGLTLQVTYIPLVPVCTILRNTGNRNVDINVSPLSLIKSKLYSVAKGVANELLDPLDFPILSYQV